MPDNRKGNEGDDDGRKWIQVHPVCMGTKREEGHTLMVPQ
jgi:hypothetical protein